jgi:hypothetical protein
MPISRSQSCGTTECRRWRLLSEVEGTVLQACKRWFFQRDAISIRHKNHTAARRLRGGKASAANQQRHCDQIRVVARIRSLLA